MENEDAAWTEDMSLFLIDAYKTHDILWNPQNMNYFRKNHKQDAWSEIAKLMAMSEERCSNKMISLLSSYRREKLKERKSKRLGKGAPMYKSRWFAYDAMKFLDDRDTPRKRKQKYSAEAAVQDVESDGDDSTSQEIPGSSKDYQSTRDPIVQETEPAQKPVQSYKRNVHRLECLVKKFKTVGEVPQPTPTPSSNSENEFDIFGRSVAAQLNAMPLVLALQAQSHIQNYLTSVRIHSIADPLELQTDLPFAPSISLPARTTSNSVSEVPLDNNSTQKREAYSP